MARASSATVLRFGSRRRENRFVVNAVWLMRLRWVAVAGQLATIATASLLFAVELQWVPLVTIVALTALSNIGFSVWLRLGGHGRETGEPRAADHRLLASVMAFDLLALTALLYFSGGPANPFTMFYFVNLALSAVIMPARWGWTLTAIAIICIAVLFVAHVPLSEFEPVGDQSTGVIGRRLTLQQQGLLVSLAACAVVVIYFITRVTRELRQRENDLREAEEQRARSERLEALGTLAAGAAHELATPLSTIAVVAKELSRILQDANVTESAIEDVALIRGEVDLCRSILDRMSVNVNVDADDGGLSSIRVRQLVAEVLGGLSHPERIDVTIDDGAAECKLLVPREALAQAVRGVVQNALDASPQLAPVTFSVAAVDDRLRVEIKDNGQGMTREELARAGEPFFTTKPPGEGMGLGLFLTRSVIERLNGTLDLQSTPGEGVRAAIEIPLETENNGADE